MKPSAEIKRFAIEANKLINQPACSARVKAERKVFVSRTTIALSSEYGDVAVSLVGNSIYSRSHYVVMHPVLGRWEGSLNSVSDVDGEYGHKPGTPWRTG